MDKYDKPVYRVWAGKLLPLTMFFPTSAEEEKCLFAFEHHEDSDPQKGKGWVRTSAVQNLERFDEPDEDGVVAVVETRNSIYKLTSWCTETNHAPAVDYHRYR